MYPFFESPCLALHSLGYCTVQLYSGAGLLYQGFCAPDWRQKLGKVVFMAMRVRAVGALAVFAVSVIVVAVWGTQISRSGVGPMFYQMQKPDWFPPGWVFAPVWTVLYTFMIIAPWLYIQAMPRGGGLPSWLYSLRTGLVCFYVQLATNWLWVYVYFGLGLLGASLWVMAFLWISVAATLVLFALRSPLAAWLFVPYLAWVSFAAVLNGVLWHLAT